MKTLLNRTEARIAISVCHRFLRRALRWVGAARRWPGRVVRLAVAIACTLGLPLLAHAAAGSLDTSFGGSGTSSFVSTFLTAKDVAVQPDGKAVVVGVGLGRVISAAGDREHAFAVGRFNLDGTRDNTFGGGAGFVLTQLSDGIDSSAEAVAIRSDGRIVVVGRASRFAGLNAEDQVAIAVYKPDGTLDESFAGDGLRIVDLGDAGLLHGGPRDSVGLDVAIQDDNKIVVVGAAEIGDDFDFFAIRLTVSGNLDEDGSSSKGFAGDGITTLGMGGEDSAKAVKIGPNGDIFIAGTVGSYDNNNILRRRIGLARLNTFGERVADFDGDGKVAYFLPDGLTAFQKEVNVKDMILQSDGKMVISGDTLNASGSNRNFFVARFLATGEFDPTFGGQGLGFAITDLGGSDVAAGMIAAPTGTGNGFIVSGSTGGHFVAVKYTQDGLLDASFGVGGVARLNVGNVPANIARGPGRRFMLSGGDDMFTARVLDVGANVVHATAFGDPSGSETKPGFAADPASFFVFREERLPFSTRVFFNIGGTARFSPTFGSDYQLFGMSVSGTPFVDIPANQTYTLVDLQPIDDTLVEGTETAAFTIQPSSGYEIGTPSSAELTIHDNDFYFSSVTPQGTRTVGNATVTPSAADLPPNGKITFDLTWTTPGVWRDLATIEFRIVDEFGQSVLAWILWDETTNEIYLLDPETGLFTEESGQPGSNHKLKGAGVELDLRHSAVVGSGPTGPSVTLTLALKLKSKTPDGLTRPLIYSVEVFASDDDGIKQGFDEVGRLRVL